MNYRITDIKNFVEIAGSRTMRDGADRLGISQPALSESIKRLEQDLGEILLYRSRTGIALTPGGLNTLNKAKAALFSLEALGPSRHINNSRLITIGCHSTIASYFLPRAFRLIQDENPDYRVRLQHNLSRDIQLAVQQGKIDVGIVVNAVPSPDLIIKLLARDEFHIWQHSKLNEKNRGTVFCNLELSQTQSMLRKWKDKPANLIDTDSLELIARFVSEGLGYGVVPARAMALLELRSCEIAPKTPSFHDSISIVYRPEFGKHPSEKSIIENLKHSVK